MAVNPTTYFTRAGRLIDLANKVDTHQALLVVEIDDILDEYNDNRDMAFTLQQSLDGFVAAAGGVLSSLKPVLEKTTIEMVNDDDPLESKTIDPALVRLQDQMINSSDDLNGTTVSASSAAAQVDGTSNSGDGEVVVAMVDERGNALQYARAEDITLVCSKDAQESGIAGRETFLVKGEEAVSNFNEDWPTGSGINNSLVLTDPSIDAGAADGKNRLSNSDFEDFTVANTPDGWAAVAGTFGTDFLKTTTQHRGTNALEIVGDGATLNEISQDITVEPNKKYCIGFWVRDDGTPPAAGTLVVSLQDSGGTIYNSATALTTASKSVDLTAVGSVYAFQSVTFETPTDLPVGGTTATIHVELTVALTSGRSIFLDGLFCARMKQFGGLGGPFILMTPGTADFIREDRFVVAITNNNEGAIVRGMDRLLDLYPKGLYFPTQTDGSETIPDSLIA